MPEYPLKQWLRETTQLLTSVSDTAALDTALIASFVLNISRASLLALPDSYVPEEQVYARLETMRAKRMEGYPIAYLTGYKEFYGYSFFVKEGVLIPRADSEIIIETLLDEHIKRPITSLRDIGTGPGTLALSLALTLKCPVTASDISPIAKEVFALNNERLTGGAVAFLEQSLLDDRNNYDVIVANLPYLTTDETTQRLEEEQWKEPALALDGGADGLDLIRTLIDQSKGHCRLLLLEADPAQMDSIRSLMEQSGYNNVRMVRDLGGQQRIILGYNEGVGPV